MAYDYALICRNGHVITSALRLMPERNDPFCEKCGAPTLQTCEQCGLPIRGSSTELILSFNAPGFCPGCGKPYPWTLAKLEAAKELTKDLDRLSAEDRERLRKSLEEIIRDTPQTPVAAMRIKRLIGKTGASMANLLGTLIQEIATEGAKKILFAAD